MADSFIIVTVMKSVAVLLSGFVALALCGASPELSQVRSVYLLPMANGLDQYLANRLANMGIFQIVADPKKADAVFTDRLGAAFENRLDELYREPAPPKPPEDTKKVEETKKPEDKQETKDLKPATPASEPARFSSFSRAKGTIFLVHTKARTILWSLYQQPKNSSPAELDRTAQRIAGRLQRDLKGK